MTVQELHQTGAEHITLITDDGQRIPTTLGIVTELRLFVGKPLEEAQLRLLKDRSAAAFARESAMTILSLRPHSKKELRDKLLRKGIVSDAADSAIAWLEEHGYLDDESYAAAVVQHYARKGYGTKRITSELFRRGISRELWEAALGKMPDSDEELDRYIRNHLKDPANPDAVRKVSSALFRRGYSWEEIRSALNRVSEFTDPSDGPELL